MSKTETVIVGRWRTPPIKPAKSRGGGRPENTCYADMAALLRRHPDRWYVAKEYTAPRANGSWGSYVKLRLQALLGAKNVEVRSAFEDGRGEVFARYRREAR